MQASADRRNAPRSASPQHSCASVVRAQAGTEAHSAVGHELATVPAQFAASSAPKLKFLNLGSPKAGECGLYKWGTGWKLDDRPTEHGIIVQHIRQNLDRFSCTGTSEPAKDEFWEAWTVSKGQLRPDINSYYDDVFQNREWLDGSTAHHGSFSTVGEAEFYPGQSVPAGFVATGALPSGDLPMSRTDPRLTGGTGVVRHAITADWNCCTAKSRKTELTTEVK